MLKSLFGNIFLSFIAVCGVTNALQPLAHADALPRSETAAAASRYLVDAIYSLKRGAFMTLTAPDYAAVRAAIATRNDQLFLQLCQEARVQSFPVPIRVRLVCPVQPCPDGSLAAAVNIESAGHIVYVDARDLGAPSPEAR